MPDMWRLRFQWKNGQNETQELSFVAGADDALAEMNQAIQNDIAPTLGESLTINATRIGQLRGTPGA